MNSSSPRGLRNFNPGNIRRSRTVWLGMAPVQNDPDFVTFISAEYGIRAIVKILESYERMGINTIRQIISRYAPPSENQTDSYIAEVCKQCALGPDEPVNLAATMAILVKAIIRREQGREPFTDAQIDAGIHLTTGAA